MTQIINLAWSDEANVQSPHEKGIISLFQHNTTAVNALFDDGERVIGVYPKSSLQHGHPKEDKRQVAEAKARLIQAKNSGATVVGLERI